MLRATFDRLSIEPKEHPILLTEPSLHSKEHRLKLTQHLFEKYQIPALFICKTSVLSAFSCGRSTSLVLESGANATYAVPVHDGYALQASMIKCDIGGNYLTEEVAKCIEGKKVNVVPRYGFTKKMVNGQPIVDYQKFELTDPSYEKYCRHDIVRDIKESLLTLVTETAMEMYEPPCYKNARIERRRRMARMTCLTGRSWTLRLNERRSPN